MAKIMLVEDEATMRMLLQTLLELDGHRVEAWMLAGDPVDLILQSQPDIVLLDVNLKGIDGFNVLRRLREDKLGEEIYVIMTSGFDYREKAKAFGANEFIMKPYMPDTLTQIIKKAGIP